MRRFKKVIVIGLDGLERSVVTSLLRRGGLPNLAKLQDSGTFGSIATTLPAQTPVAWSTFATGKNPGGHGVFDFLRRDPATYLPQLGLNRYQSKSPFVPPKVVNLRRAKTLWEHLTDRGVESVVLRCPCTYPPDRVNGRLLAGMGVPDVRGALGVSSFYSTRADVTAGESETVAKLRFQSDGQTELPLAGPLHPKTLRPCEARLTLRLDRATRSVQLASDERNTVTVAVGVWSDWLRVTFSVGLLQRVHGMVRFFLVRLDPDVEIYASPVNYPPDAPPFPISSPPQYAAELAGRIGTFYTTGMVEDHAGLENGRIDDAAFLAQCNDAWREREAMMLYELARLDEGFFFCLFDTPDRVQHMFWRSGIATAPDSFGPVIEDQYRRADDVVGQALQFADDNTLLMALSDHGFGSFDRGVHLNSWLLEQGLLRLKGGVRPGPDGEDMLRSVDWSRTQAYALGLGGIYLNLREREAEGIVAPDDAPPLEDAICRRLTGLVDHQRGTTAVRGATPGHTAFTGEFASEAPDVMVRYSRGYRASWETAMGGVPQACFADNHRRWSGDHIVDPELVPGVLFANRPLKGNGAHLVDLAPTVLAALGVPPAPEMEGVSLLP